MALAIGADTRQMISGSSGSFSHTQASGSDGLLFMVIMWQTTRTINSFTYDSVEATFLTSGNAGSSRSWGLYNIPNPSTGANNVSLTLDSSPSFSSYVFVCSFTGSSGVTQWALEPPTADPVSHTFASSVDSASIVLCGGFAPGYTAALDVEIPNGTDGTSLDGYTITGVGRTDAEKNTSTVSGTVEVEINAPLGNPSISLWTAEIGEGSGSSFIPSLARDCISFF